MICDKCHSHLEKKPYFANQYFKYECDICNILYNEDNHYIIYSISKKVFGTYNDVEYLIVYYLYDNELIVFKNLIKLIYLKETNINDAMKWILMDDDSLLNKIDNLATIA